MSDKEIAKTLNNAGITAGITCPQAPSVAKKALVSVTGPGKYRTYHEIKIHGCPPGCLR